MIPRTPYECQLPRPAVLRTNVEGKDGRGRRFAAGGRCTQNPWITPLSHPKSLIVYKTISTGRRRFSTGCVSLSTGRRRFSTGLVFRLFRAFFSISLFLKEEEKRESREKKNRHPRVFESAYFFIHGFLFRSTGNAWICVDWFMHEKQGVEYA